MQEWRMYKSSQERRSVREAWSNEDNETMQQWRMCKICSERRSMHQAWSKGRVQTMQQWRMHEICSQRRSVHETWDKVDKKGMQQWRLHKSIQKGGACIRHGAYHNTSDQSTAFGSEYEKTTASHTPTSQSALGAVPRGSERGSVPEEVTILCQEIVESNARS